ncbi:Hypothetical predicted protein [Octopus vulgaris]|uniref:Uncharacterized protein n=1 Tax=Octopus vulgaris TaxID=6645 RepID=A0AA36ALF1_OCTVU|nr:Hypothetical predicted protein [Octopus vulgaris]
MLVLMLVMALVMIDVMEIVMDMEFRSSILLRLCQCPRYTQRIYLTASKIVILLHCLLVDTEKWELLVDMPYQEHSSYSLPFGTQYKFSIGISSAAKETLALHPQ